MMEIRRFPGAGERGSEQSYAALVLLESAIRRLSVGERAFRLGGPGATTTSTAPNLLYGESQ
jgi:hypothetical protein